MPALVYSIHNVADDVDVASCSHPSSYFAELYRKHGLEGGHVIKLGPGNDRAAKDALAAWPGAVGCALRQHSFFSKIRLLINW